MMAAFMIFERFLSLSSFGTAFGVPIAGVLWLPSILGAFTVGTVLTWVGATRWAMQFEVRALQILQAVVPAMIGATIWWLNLLCEALGIYYFRPWAANDAEYRSRFLRPLGFPIQSYG